MSKSVLKPTLALKNAHPRDPNLVFDEPSHKYTITTDPNSKYTSVTTWNHSHFPHFDADTIICKWLMNHFKIFKYGILLDDSLSFLIYFLS